MDDLRDAARLIRCEGVYGIKDDDLDAAPPNACRPRTVVQDQGAVAGGQFLVSSGDSPGQVRLSSLLSDGTRNLGERHSVPFDSISLNNRSLFIGARAPLRFSLPEASATARKTAWEVRSGDGAYVELRDATDAASTWRPWVPCATTQRSLYWLPPSVFAIPCGTELLFATTAAPGVIARLRQIEDTDTAYALFTDGTAELFGRKTCQSCLADSECGDGSVVMNPNSRCVPMTFDGTQHGMGCLASSVDSGHCAGPVR